MPTVQNHAGTHLFPLSPGALWRKPWPPTTQRGSRMQERIRFTGHWAERVSKTSVDITIPVDFVFGPEFGAYDAAQKIFWLYLLSAAASYQGRANDPNTDGWFPFAQGHAYTLLIYEEISIDETLQKLQTDGFIEWDREAGMVESLQNQRPM